MANPWLVWSTLAFVGGAVAAGFAFGEDEDGGVGTATPFGGTFTTRQADEPLVVRVENDGSADVLATLTLLVNGREVEREEMRVPPGAREVGFTTAPTGTFTVRGEFRSIDGSSRASTTETASPAECDRGEQLVIVFDVQGSRRGMSLGRGSSTCR